VKARTLVAGAILLFSSPPFSMETTMLCFTFIVLFIGFLLGSTNAAAPVAGRTSRVKVVAKEKNAINVFLATIREARSHLAAAAVARSVSIFAMYPVDTIKVSKIDRYCRRL
jgi:hypothetical protein